MDKTTPPPLSDPAWRAAIGPRAGRYLPVFEKIEARGGGWVANWNWAAFAGSIMWFFYRRMPRLAVANLLLPPVAAFFTPMLLMVLLPAPAMQFISWITLSVYLALAFVALPIYADALYYRDLKRRIADRADSPARIAALAPSWNSVLGGVVLGACIPAGIITVTLISHREFDTRVKVSDAIVASSDIRESVTAFHAQQKRLPSQEEAAGLPSRAAGTKVQSITWDASGQRIVITLATPMAGKQLALHAQVREGSIEWTCRNIDVPSKYVPISCRNQAP